MTASEVIERLEALERQAERPIEAFHAGSGEFIGHAVPEALGREIRMLRLDLERAVRKKEMW